MFILLVGVALFLGALALQTGDPAIPSSVLILIPVLGQAITYAALKLGLADKQKRNLSAGVAGIMALAAVALGPINLPALACSGDLDVGACLGSVQVFGVAIYGLWLVVWKVQQIIYDMIAGQVASPDGAAERIAEAGPPAVA